MDNENIYDVAYTDGNTGEGNWKPDSEDVNKEHKKNKPKKSNNGNGIGKYVAIALICSLCGGFVGSGATYLLLKNGVVSNGSSTNNIQADPVSFASNGEAMSITDVYNKVAPAVVIVSTKSIQNYNGWFSQEVEGIGSGFIVNEDGYILTNYHVIKGAKEVTVTLSDGTETQASVVNYDENQDVAMIKITDSSVKVPAVVELGDSNALQTGEEVLAIGTPLSKDLSYTLTNGIVSALNRNVETDNGMSVNLIQTNAAINPGNSGGPLINTKGQVIGINTMKMSSDDVEGLGFAIPINDVKEKIDSLSKPILNLGVSVRQVDETLAKKLNMEQGLYVVEVNEFSPAEKAGLKNGDLITSVDGKRIKTFDELKEIKNSKQEGDTLTIDYIRDGKTRSTILTLSAN